MGNEAYIDSMCFDTQQSIEFLLKGVLISYGVGFDKTHEIDRLLQLVESDTPIKFSKRDDLEMLAATITYWEEGSRYMSGVKTTINTVRRCLNIRDSLMDDFLSEQERLQDVNEKESLALSEEEENLDL